MDIVDILFHRAEQKAKLTQKALYFEGCVQF